MSNNSTTRFANRVDDYVKYRPHYPVEIVAFLEQHYQLSPDKLIADIGAGTGISAELFLDAGYKVIAIEPNKEMREKSIALLQHRFSGFYALDGTAENTGLEEENVDAIIAGQAFHWFDREKAKVEFERILKPGGIVVLVWNERNTISGFEKEYDELIKQHGKDYVTVDHRNISDEFIAAFFNPAPVQLEVFKNQQVFDFNGLEGRLLSSSYMPSREDEGYERMISAVRHLFDRYQENDRITIHYATKVYVGRLNKEAR